MKNLILLIAFVLTTANAQTPLTNTFTYQGELKMNNALADGTFDFEFNVFDVATNGSVLETVVVEDVTVTNGVFTTSITLTMDLFTGNMVWLDIGVRDGASTGAFDALSPRQEVTSSPYAIHAQFVGTVGADAVTGVQIANSSVGTSEIIDNSITSSDITDSTITSNDLANDSVTSAKILDRTITSIDIAFNSIGSNEITNNSVGGIDIKDSQVQRRVSGLCELPTYMAGINQNGNVICQRLPVSYNTELGILGGKFTSLAIGNDGNPIIAYTDVNSKLEVIKCLSPSCNSFKPPISLDQSVLTMYLSLAIGADNNPIISYYDRTNLNLKIVKCTTSNCANFIGSPSHNTPEILDVTGDVGKYSSIAIGTDNNPIISYSNQSNGLKVIKCTNQDCTSFNTPSILDSSSSVSFTKIVIGADNNPIIAYKNSSPTELRVVKCLSQNCNSFISPKVIDTSLINTVNGYDIDMSLGSDNNPVISYINLTDTSLTVAELRFVKCLTQSCSLIEPPVIIEGIGYDSGVPGTSVAVGADNNPIISYAEGTNGDLKIVKCNTPNCSNFNIPIVLDSIGRIGGYSSIAIDIQNNPIISYYDLTNRNLKIYSCSDIECKK